MSANSICSNLHGPASKINSRVLRIATLLLIFNGQSAVSASRTTAAAATATDGRPRGGDGHRGIMKHVEEFGATTVESAVGYSDLLSTVYDVLDDDDITIPALLTRHLWSNNELLVEASLQKLGDLCVPGEVENADENIAEIYQFGGQTVVLGVMNKHANSVPILAEAMRVLNNAAREFEHGNMSASIGQLGGIEKILEIMKRFPREEILQSHGAGTLSSLLFQNGENSWRFVQQGGLGSLIDAMREFPGNPRLYDHACNAIHIIGDWKQQVLYNGAENVVEHVELGLAYSFC